MTTALLITLIGMTLVFAAIILLGLVMALIVRFAQNQKEVDDELLIISAGEVDTGSKSASAVAAALAVAMALENDSSRPHPFPLPPTAFVSAWQAVLRSRTHSKRGGRR